MLAMHAGFHVKYLTVRVTFTRLLSASSARNVRGAAYTARRSTLLPLRLSAVDFAILQRPDKTDSDAGKEDSVSMSERMAKLEQGQTEQKELLLQLVADSKKVPSTSGPAEEPADALSVKLARLAAKRAKKTSSSASGSGKPADPRRPKPFSGEGDQAKAGAVRRFINALSLFFRLSNIAPDLWAYHATLYLEGTALDNMHTAMQSLPDAECTWVKFYALLSARFGNIDPDTEFWDQLCDLRQGDSACC